MSGKIQCTFEGCYQKFASVEAMRKHKAKTADENDGVHDHYCKRCDEDCADDIDFLIHQIQSQKHIVCPACGKEFKSESGRDRHVGIYHRQKQRLNCPGCNVIFTDAAGLMGHIEGNKCKVIMRDDFHKHKAEQQIEQDAFEEIRGGAFQGSTVISASTDSDYGGGTSLADDQRVRNPSSWDQPAAYTGDPFDGRHISTAQAMSDLAIDKYPPLVAEKAPTKHSVLNAGAPSRHRYEFDHEDDTSASTAPKHILDTSKSWGNIQTDPTASSIPLIWSNNSAAGVVREPVRPALAKSVNLLDTMDDDKIFSATRGMRVSQAGGRTDMISPAARAETQDPNAPFAQVQTKQAKAHESNRQQIQAYWNSVLGCYVCPGQNCGRKLRSVEDFEAHLLSGVHVGARVQCPSCLKKFNTTTALVAHAESGSTKCELRKTEEFDLAMRNITAGLIKVEG